MTFLEIILVFITGSVTTSFFVWTLMSKLKQAGIVGEDMHKPGKPEVPEMGGLAITAGFTAGLLVIVGLSRFTALMDAVDIEKIFAVGFTVLLIALLGTVDDLLQVGQVAKALLPFLAALPLVVIKAGKASMNLPIFGSINFGLFYPLVLVPFGVTGAANAFNMLAGFNGLETGLGVVIVGALAFVAWLTESFTALAILVAIFGALLVTFYYNWYPARILIGDVGTLTIGATVAIAVIIGNYEYAGIIIIIPYLVDLVLKAAGGFPKSFGDLRDGKLYCPEDGPVGLAQLVMKLFRGISERGLVLVLLGVELLFSWLAILYYL